MKLSEKCQDKARHLLYAYRAIESAERDVNQGFWDSAYAAISGAILGFSEAELPKEIYADFKPRLENARQAVERQDLKTALERLSDIESDAIDTMFQEVVSCECRRG